MKLACESIDRVLTTEIRLPFLTRGIIPAEYEAARAKIGGPISYAMASAILKCLEEGKNRVAVFTGVYHPENFPNGESDGPLGAAVVGNAIEKLGGDVTYCLEKETIPGTVHMLAGAIDEVNPALEAADPYVKAELNAKNIEVVGSQAFPMQTMFGSGKAPKTLDDLKGLKMRVFDPYQADLLAAIGVSPVSMVMSEVPSSMQKNVINSSLTGVIGAYEAKWYDICDWAYLMPVAASNCYMIINKSLLDGLPADIRQIIYEEGEKYTEAVNAYNEEAIPNAAKRLEENGVTVVYPSEEDIKKMEAIAADFWESWSNDYTDNVKECYKAIKSALNK